MIDKVIKQIDCTGCCGCANICPQQCISMVSDAEGFWYPQVDYDRCIACSKCVNHCAPLHVTRVENEPRAIACFNNNESARVRSSSGGIFPLVAEYVLEGNGLVYGVGLDDHFRAVHSCVEDISSLEDLYGSKYVQSNIGITYRHVEEQLKQGRKVLFSGTPCQVSGLKHYLGKEYSGLFTADIICHGVPSPKVWQKYLSYREQQAASRVIKVSFREKTQGWRLYSMEVSFDGNAHYNRNLREDSFMKAFLKNVCLRPSCYDCRFKSLHRMSDITLGDFWGVEHVLPEFDDDKGTSLVFINSEKGQSIFKAIEELITYKPVNIVEAVRYNSTAIMSVKRNPTREKFFANLDKIGFDELVHKYCCDRLLVRIKRKILTLRKALMRRFGISN
jgi:coenzyme F420-reducing hydrogenase beta subunit